MSEPRWHMVLADLDDPHRHTARATRREDSPDAWNVTYRRNGRLVSTGGISTPPPHDPPIATLVLTLKQLRGEADYWAEQDREEQE